MKKSRALRAGVCLVGIVMAGSGIVGCSVSEAASSLADYGNRNAGGSTETEGREIGPNGQLLPPGVKAPEEPAQPGAAKLRPDGHYDYSAPDFVLGDPCEDPELMSRLAEQGWAIWDSPRARISTNYLKGCVLSNANPNSEPLTVVAINASATTMESEGYLHKFHSNGENSWFTANPPSGFGELCVAVHETQSGSVGIGYRYSEFKIHKTLDQACQYVSTSFEDFFGGKK